MALDDRDSDFRSLSPAPTNHSLPPSQRPPDRPASPTAAVAEPVAANESHEDRIGRMLSESQERRAQQDAAREERRRVNADRLRDLSSVYGSRPSPGSSHHANAGMPSSPSPHVANGGANAGPEDEAEDDSPRPEVDLDPTNQEAAPQASNPENVSDSNAAGQGDGDGEEEASHAPDGNLQPLCCLCLSELCSGDLTGLWPTCGHTAHAECMNENVRSCVVVPLR